MVDSFCATALSGVQVPVLGVDPVPPELVVVEPDVVFDAVVVVPDCVDVGVVVPPFVFAEADVPFGVVDFANFVVAPLEVAVAFGAADEPFTFAVDDLTGAPVVVALSVVVLGP